MMDLLPPPPVVESNALHERIAEALSLIADMAPDVIEEGKVDAISRVVSWAVMDLHHQPRIITGRMDGA